jgi:hypothetical protein
LAFLGELVDEGCLICGGAAAADVGLQKIGVALLGACCCRGVDSGAEVGDRLVVVRKAEFEQTQSFGSITRVVGALTPEGQRLAGGSGGRAPGGR